MKGIYEITKDKLRICIAEGNNERPTEFATRLPLSLIKRLRIVAVQSERRVQDIVREALEPAVEKLEKQVA